MRLIRGKLASEERICTPAFPCACPFPFYYDAVSSHTDTATQRADVTEALAKVIDNPDAKGLGMDIVGGEENIGSAVERFVKAGVTDWHG